MRGSQKNFGNDLKIIVVGNAGTGKTSFVNKWTKNTFSDTYKATIVSEFGYKIFNFKGKFFRIQLWDLADAHGCVILADITNPNSLQETIKWKNSIDENARLSDGSLLPCLLIENKIDLVSEDQIKNDFDIKDFAKKNNFIEVFRSSAKQGININESMEYIISNIISKNESLVKNSYAIVNEKNKRSIVLDTRRANSIKDKSKDGCC